MTAPYLAFSFSLAAFISASRRVNIPKCLAASAGKNWRGGEYIENMRLSPRERYVYYIASTGQRSPSYGMPAASR